MRTAIWGTPIPVEEQQSMRVRVIGEQKLKRECIRSCFIPPNQYPTVESLLSVMTEELNKCVEKIFIKEKAHPNYSNYKRNGKYVWMNLAAERNQVNPLKLVMLTASDHFYNNQITFKVHFAKELQFQLGYTDYPMLDLGWFTIKNITIEAFHYPDLFRNTLRSLWIFCDIVQPSFVGGNLAPYYVFFQLIHRHIKYHMKLLIFYNSNQLHVVVSNQ